MPASLHFAESPGKVIPLSSTEECRVIGDKKLSVNRVCVVIGRKEDVLEQVKLLSKLSSSINLSLVEKVLKSTSVSETNGSTCSFIFDEADHVIDVTLILLSSVASRHNSPTRPDIVHEHFSSSLTHSLAENESKSTHVTPVHVLAILPKVPSVETSSSVVAVASGIARSLPLYTRKGNKTETETRYAIEVSFFSVASNKFESSFNSQAQLVAEGIRKASALVDMPCNELFVGSFVDIARKLVADLQKEFPKQNVSIEVVEGRALEQRGFGGIWGVGKASEEAGHAPALIILSQRPEKEKATDNIVWAGKGIVYDTGGLSIKDKTGMPGMKRDMGAAAAMLYTFEAAVRSEYSQNLYTLLAMAENSVGSYSTRPDDIHTLYSGLTVEINNTDAEGRLVLADCVAYATKHLSPTVLVDMCTLTGAQGIATGKKHAGIVCTDEDLERNTIKAGRDTGDLVHPLPYCPEFFSPEFSSSVADMKNSVKNRNNAQSSCAAQFIANHFVSYTNPWLHIDMASPVYKGERATGYGVALLLELFVFNSNKK